MDKAQREVLADWLNQEDPEEWGRLALLLRNLAPQGGAGSPRRPFGSKSEELYYALHRAWMQYRIDPVGRALLADAVKAPDGREYSGVTWLSARASALAGFVILPGAQRFVDSGEPSGSEPECVPVYPFRLAQAGYEKDFPNHAVSLDFTVPQATEELAREVAERCILVHERQRKSHERALAERVLINQRLGEKKTPPAIMGEILGGFVTMTRDPDRDRFDLVYQGKDRSLRASFTISGTEAAIQQPENLIRSVVSRIREQIARAGLDPYENSPAV